MQYFLLLFGYTEVDLTIHLFSKKNDFRENDKSTTPTLFDQVGGGNKEVKSMSGQLYGCQNIEHGKSLCKAFKHDVCNSTFQNSQDFFECKL